MRETNRLSLISCIFFYKCIVFYLLGTINNYSFAKHCIFKKIIKVIIYLIFCLIKILFALLFTLKIIITKQKTQNIIV